MDGSSVSMCVTITATIDWLVVCFAVTLNVHTGCRANR